MPLTLRPLERRLSDAANVLRGERTQRPHLIDRLAPAPTSGTASLSNPLGLMEQGAFQESRTIVQWQDEGDGLNAIRISKRRHFSPHR